MIETPLTIINEKGLHARASSKLSGLAQTFSCAVTLSVGDKQADAKNILQLMMLAAARGTKVLLQCDGEDQQQASEAIAALVNNYFEEGQWLPRI